MATGQEYCDFVRLMYQHGFYVTSYNIDLMSEEVSCVGNKIIISPIISNDEKFTYVFTGKVQKQKILGEPTKFKLYLEDVIGNEFKDKDNIMVSIVKTNSTPSDLYTRPYGQWKFGVTFDNGIYLDEDNYLIFQTIKEIGKFDMEINDIDLFIYKPRKDIRIENMMWLD